MSDMEEDCTLSAGICQRDVYDLAADIATEFEAIVPLCGCDLIVPVVSKVVTALEQLENAVGIMESTATYVTELKKQIRDLHTRKAADAETKIRLEEDLSHVEESWTKEIQELKDRVIHLQEENRNLQQISEEQIDQPNHATVDHQLIQALKNKMSILNRQLAEKETRIEKQETDIFMLKQSIQKQEKVTTKLHACISESQCLVENLSKEKELLSEKVMQQEEILQLFQKRNCDYLANLSSDVAAGEDADYFERKRLLLKIKELEHKLSLAENNRILKNVCLNGSDPTNIIQKRSSISKVFQLFLGILSRQAETFRCY